MEPLTHREIKMSSISCPKCKWLEEVLFNTVDDYSMRGRSAYELAMKQYINHDPTTHEDKVVGSHKGNGKPNGIFAGTLTMSPTDPTNENEMCAAIHKIFTQRTVPVKRYAWYLEYTDANLPHVHFIYETDTGGRIHAKVFKRYWKTWDEKVKQGKGFRGGYHKLVESETAYTEYIAKDGNIRSKDSWYEVVE